jgi:hypothetical protein
MLGSPDTQTNRLLSPISGPTTTRCSVLRQVQKHSAGLLAARITHIPGTPADTIRDTSQ